MNKIKLALIVLILAAGVEFWLLTRLWNPEKNIIPSNTFSYISPTEMGLADSFITIRGSWFSEAKLAFPVQASEIQCWKDKNMCVESLAQVKDSYLSAESSIYDIVSWNEKEIIAKQDASCKTLELKIDRIRKQATLNSTTTGTKDLCAGISKEPMLLYLVNGYDAWQKNKNK